MQAIIPSREYLFDGYRLDTVSRRLLRVSDGEVVSLTPKAFDLLHYLVANAGRTVSKDEIFESVWENSAVEESNLSQTIFVLRKTLCDSKKLPKYLLTIPGTGYQFVSEVTSSGEKQGISDPRKERGDRRGTDDPEAYRSYVRGRFFWNKRTSVGLKKAVEFFEKAIEKDPKFANAYTGLADSYRLLADYYEASTPNISAPKAKAALSQTQQIDEQLAEAHASLAYAQAFYDWDWQTAETSFRSSIDLDPSNATTRQWYGEYLMVLGRFDEAREQIDRAVALEPESPTILTALAAYFYTIKDSDALIAHARKLIKLDPTYAYGHFYLGFGYEFAEMYARAIDSFAKAAIYFGEPEDCADELKRAYKIGGMNAVWYKRIEQYASRPHLKDYPSYLKSLVPARLGDTEMMFAFLEQALEHRDRGLIYVKYEPFLSMYRDEPRMKAIIRELGLE
ncbi:MAG TPA: winged helix-turn-helix domain-containing protein [Pyrinomonadaceae bacterium]|nr:winged helix-turn-helix domain-containing protein [Pyrinomonadaceae bacterium]